MRVRGRDAALLLISGTDYHRYVTRYRLLYEFHESTNAAPHPTLPDFTPILKIQADSLSLSLSRSLSFCALRERAEVSELADRARV